MIRLCILPVLGNAMRSMLPRLDYKYESEISVQCYTCLSGGLW